MGADFIGNMQNSRHQKQLPERAILFNVDTEYENSDRKESLFKGQSVKNKTQ